ncbi:hypothetical protein ACJMK2_033014 [Sinanodonta woodiana]|uniref:Alpha-1,3-glucosyltransferase n=1 Tax=Sinanodonta woodiana TaxID=1069815 RepID=A0ABD3X732_SINWO
MLSKNFVPPASPLEKEVPIPMTSSIVPGSLCLLLLSITRIYQERNLEGAFWFAVLLNLKHIYLFVAPAYFVYLLRCYCFQSHADGRIRWDSFSPVRLISLGIIVLSVFAVSFGPFIHMGQLLQLLSRLFPVKRGLCHAYWAPNFWVLYNVADKAATVSASKFNLLAIESNRTAVMTGGLVQEYDHVVLPSITPFVTLVVTLLAITPSLFLLWSRPRGPASFVRALVLCAFGSFMFSWHVHEKAILLIILPLSLLMLYKKKDAQLFLVISTVGHYSLFPLLYRQQEIPIKVCLLLIYTLYIYAGLGKMFGFSWSWSSLPLLSQAESLYILGLVPLELYNSVIHSALGLSERLPFLPLLLTSFYCAVGVTYSWIKFYWLTFQEKPRKTEGKMQ